jgi:hypothetical protein
MLVAIVSRVGGFEHMGRRGRRMESRRARWVQLTCCYVVTCLLLTCQVLVDLRRGEEQEEDGEQKGKVGAVVMVVVISLDVAKDLSIGGSAAADKASTYLVDLSIREEQEEDGEQKGKVGAVVTMVVICCMLLRI